MIANAAILIRRLQPSDVDSVVHGWHATNRASYGYVAEIQRHTLEDDRRFFELQLAPACEVWVATIGSNIVGMMALDGCWIRHFAIFEGFRGHGIGARMLEQARQRSPIELRLFTFQRNTGARRFYERHGFEAVAFGVSPPPELEPDVEYAWRAPEH